jgi:hypothetical protein
LHLLRSCCSCSKNAVSRGKRKLLGNDRPVPTYRSFHALNLRCTYLEARHSWQFRSG